MSFAHVVLVGSGVAHLDRAYTYRVPEATTVHVGSLVRVPVRGRPREGVVVGLLDEPDVAHVQPIRAVLGPGLTPEIVALCTDVAEHYLSSPGEALAAALPPRVASEESNEAKAWPGAGDERGDLAWLGSYKNGGALLKAVRSGGYRAFAWRPLAAEHRGAAYVSLAAEALRRDRGALVLMPEVRAISSVAEALGSAFGDAVAWLGSDRSPRDRYRAWLALRRGDALIAAGGRGAVFAPVERLGLVVVDDESHVSYKERRSPRFHARGVAAGRARASGAVFVAAGVPPSGEVSHAMDRGSLTAVVPRRATEMRSRPAVVVVDRTKEPGRLTPSARTLAAIRQPLETGRRAVLLVHRRGDEARAIAQRTVRILRPRNPARLDSRTLSKDPEAFRRALRESDLIVSSPVIAKDLELAGLGCIAVVEADAALAVPEFRAAEEAFATWWRAGRWLQRDGSIVIETAHPRAPAIAALVRWDPGFLWRAEAARRSELGYPPFAALVRIDAPGVRSEDIVREVRAAVSSAEILGPVEQERRAVVIVRSSDRAGLLDSLRPLSAKWRAEGSDVRVDVDPREVLP